MTTPDARQKNALEAWNGLYRRAKELHEAGQNPAEVLATGIETLAALNPADRESALIMVGAVFQNAYLVKQLERGIKAYNKLAASRHKIGRASCRERV